MGRILRTHNFGPHRVTVLELADDDGASYLVLVDQVVVTDPLPAPPRFEDVVRIYATSRGQA